MKRALKKHAKHKITIKPTAYGWFFLFLLIWIPFTAVATANNFLFIVFIMLMGVAIVSHKLAKKNLNSIVIERRVADEIFAQTPFTIKYLITTGRNRWGALSLIFREREPLEMKENGCVFSKVPPHITVIFNESATISSRGDKIIKPGIVLSAFPFGLATYSKICCNEESVLVFPKIERLSTELPVWLGGSGKKFEKMSPLGTVPYSFREYMTGDPYKHIDWKKSAQAGSLVTKILADEQAKELVISLPENASERAISKAASLIVHFAAMGARVALEGPGWLEGPDSGKEFTKKILTILARWPNKPSNYFGAGRARGIFLGITESGELRLTF